MTPKHKDLWVWGDRSSLKLHLYLWKISVTFVQKYWFTYSWVVWILLNQMTLQCRLLICFSYFLENNEALWLRGINIQHITVCAKTILHRWRDSVVFDAHGINYTLLLKLNLIPLYIDFQDWAGGLSKQHQCHLDVSRNLAAWIMILQS